MATVDWSMSHLELQFCDGNIVLVTMIALSKNDYDKPNLVLTSELFGELLCISHRSNLSVIRRHLASRLRLLSGTAFREFALFSANGVRSHAFPTHFVSNQEAIVRYEH
jgi:hypothetical protein